VCVYVYESFIQICNNPADFSTCKSWQISVILFENTPNYDKKSLNLLQWSCLSQHGTHFQPHNHTSLMYVYKSIFNWKFLKYGMCKHWGNFNFNVDKCRTNTCLSPTMCFNTKHLSTLEYSTPNLITPKTSNPVWKWNNSKSDITLQQGTFHTKYAESKNTTQYWFTTADLTYISQLKTAQSPLIKLVLPSHVTDYQAPLMMMKPHSWCLHYRPQFIIPSMMFYIKACSSWFTRLLNHWFNVT
jgi:hypothetical protein